MAQIISVNITKGGCGKTTTVQAMGELLGKEGKRVLCVDTDAQVNLSTVSGIDVMEWQEHNLYTLLRKESNIRQCICKSKYYDVLVGSLLLASADITFNTLGREYLLKECLNEVVNDYDYILIDTPPSLSVMNIMTLTASDKIIIPMECSYLAMIGFEQLCDTIESVKKYSNENLEILGVLPIKVSKTNLTKMILAGLEDLAKKVGSKVFDARIRETVQIKEAQSQLELLTEWCPNSTAMTDYAEFIKELNTK